MFHHNHGVSCVAQSLQGSNQAGIVALVQTNRRFVQHVQHIHQLTTDLRSQANALRLTTRQGFRRTVQGQIGQSHFHDKTKPRVDFLHDFHGDSAFLVREIIVHVCKPFAQIGDVHLRQFANVLSTDLKEMRLFFQSRSFAGWTFFAVHETLRPALNSRRTIFRVATDEIDNPFKTDVIVSIRTFHSFISVENSVHHFFVDVSNGRIEFVSFLHQKGF